MVMLALVLVLQRISCNLRQEHWLRHRMHSMSQVLLAARMQLKLEHDLLLPLQALVLQPPLEGAHLNLMPAILELQLLELYTLTTWLPVQEITLISIQAKLALQAILGEFSLAALLLQG